MKRQAIDNPKFGRLKRRLDVPTYAVVGLLEMLWHFAAKNAPDGAVGKWSNEDLAVALDWRGNEDDLVNALLATGWLDACEKHRLIVHDWPHHCDDSVHMTIARKLDLFADGHAPSVARLGKNERERVEAGYREKYGEDVLKTRAINSYVVRTKQENVRTDTEDEHTESAEEASDEHTQCAQRALAVRTAIPSHTIPSPAIPSHTIPSHTIPNHSTPVVEDTEPPPPKKPRKAEGGDGDSPSANGFRRIGEDAEAFRQIIAESKATASQRRRGGTP